MRLELAVAAARLGTIALLCWALCRAIVLRRVPRPFSPRREGLLAATVLYGAVVAVITIVPLRMTNDRATRVSFMPLGSVLDCITGTHGPPEAPQFCVENVFGNVMLFMPFGALLPAINGRLRPAPAVVLAAVLVSASIEIVQWAEQRIGVGRTVDIDDVLWNGVGAYAGYLCVREASRRWGGGR